MKYILFILAFAIPVTATASTLEWDRNGETDMKDYQVWACFTPNCIVVKSATTLQPGPVAQPVPGAVPSYSLDITSREGSVAISARDQSLNESVLSVSVPFDAKAPGAPVSPRFR